MRDAQLSDRDWTQIIRGGYLEIPGLRLTRDQIQQLWGLCPDACTTVLDRLLQQRFLQVTSDGYYVQAKTSPRASHVEASHRHLAISRH